MEQWIQIISTYGVSIAAMIALAVYIVKKDKENQAVINEIMNEHKSAFVRFREKQVFC